MNRDVENLLRLQWFFPSWILLWYFFVFWSWEALATLCAIEWLLSCVIPFMNLHLMWKSSCHFCCTSMVVSFKDPLMVLLCILILRSSCHTLCIWMAFLQCDSLHESSPDVEKLLSHLVHFIDCFLHGSSGGTSTLLILRSSCHTLCNWIASLQCDSLHEYSPDVEKLL